MIFVSSYEFRVTSCCCCWFCVVGLGVCRLDFSNLCVLSALRNDFELSVIFTERHFSCFCVFRCTRIYILVVLSEWLW